MRWTSFSLFYSSLGLFPGWIANLIAQGSEWIREVDTRLSHDTGYRYSPSHLHKVLSIISTSPSQQNSSRYHDCCRKATNHQQMQQAVFYAPSHAGSFLLAAPSHKLAASRRVVARGAAACCMLYIDCPGSTVSISLLQPPPCLPSRCRTGCLRCLDLAQFRRASLIWPGLHWRCSYMCSHAPHILSNDKTRFVVNSFGVA